MSSRMPGYIKRQIPLPGLDILAKPRIEKRQSTMVDLERRILALEMEVFLLQMQLEKGRT